MKTILRLLAAILIILTTSCAKTKSLSHVTPIQTNTPPTKTISPTKAIIPISSPSPTIAPFIRFSNEIQGEWFYLGHYKGTWSPTSNELLLVSNLPPWVNNSTILKRATTPYFDSITITTLAMGNVEVSTTWSPDGQFILFNGPYPEVPPYEQGYASIWIMDKLGNNPHSLQPDRLSNGRQWFYSGFLGWINNTTVVTVYGCGSGFACIEGIDILTGRSLFSGGVSSGVFAPHGEYIPYVALGNTRVLDSKYYNPEIEQHQAPYIRDPTVDGERLNGLFQGWFPQSNNSTPFTTHVMGS
jgi:hypothetical protein